MNNWQRVSPIALLYFFFNNVMLLVNNFIYLIPVIFTSYKKVLENPFWLGIGVLGVLALFGLGAFLQFYFFKYRLGEQTIEIKAGVIFKKHLNLPFSRIQNVKLIAPVYFRPFGYTSVELDTAGSAKSEAIIVALDIHLAERLKREILAQVTEQAPAGQETTDADHQETVLNRRSLKDLVIHGLTNNRVWIFLAMLAPMIEPTMRNSRDFLTSIGIDLEQIFSPQTHAWWELGVYALGLLLLSYVIVMLFSIVGSIIAFYGFTLSKQGDNYIRRSGLLTRHEVVMKLPRLQLVIRQQDWLDILINRINLRFEQTKSIVNAKPGMEIRNKIMVPSINDQQCRHLIDDVWPANSQAIMNYARISKRFIVKYISVLSVLPITLGGFFMYHERPLLSLAAVALFGFICLFVVMRWLRWGYAMDKEFIYIRKGLLGVNYYVFPIHKIQQTVFKQSWFMRRRGLASIILLVASGAQKIPFMPAVMARQIINESLFHVESTKRNWM